MRYLSKIDFEKVAKIEASFGGNILKKYRLYLSAIGALNEANEDRKGEVLALVIEIEKELFAAIEQAISARFSTKTLSQYAQNNNSFEENGRKKRDLKKSLILDLVISQMLAILTASSGLSQKIQPERQQ